MKVIEIGVKHQSCSHCYASGVIVQRSQAFENSFGQFSSSDSWSLLWHEYRPI